uniref:Uncharacterized protein n=1 Tax=Rhizophora mucronata TaxID=61149 RepID=A0A2P2IZ21_RHIMU
MCLTEKDKYFQLSSQTICVLYNIMHHPHGNSTWCGSYGQTIEALVHSFTLAMMINVKMHSWW